MRIGNSPWVIGHPLQEKRHCPLILDVIAYAKRNGCGQDEVMKWLDGTTGRGCIAAFGSQKRCMADSGNSSSKPSMEDRMAISVGGTLGVESQPQLDYMLSEYKRIVNAMKENRPSAVYESVSASGVFSPSDDAITNYIVLSGKITLNPVRPTYTYMKNVKPNMEAHRIWVGGDKADDAMFKVDLLIGYMTLYTWRLMLRANISRMLLTMRTGISVWSMVI